MAVLPANFSRVPTMLTSSLLLSNITRSNLDLFNVQQQISSGQRLNRPSDDPVAAAMIASLRERLGLAAQRGRNLDHASSVLGALDTGLTEATDLVREAQTIAISQIGLTSDPTTRQQQAVVVDSLIAQLRSLANRKTSGVYLFGGATSTREPIRSLLGGYQYTAQGAGGMLTDLGTGDPIPITLGSSPIGQTSARLTSIVPMNPNLALDTPLADVRGARGLGVAEGSITFSVNGGAGVSVDLAGAANIGEVVNRVTAAIRQYEADNSTTVLAAGAIGVGGTGLTVQTVAGVTLEFGETANGTTAADLGLAGITFDTGTTSGAGLDPRLKITTRLGDISGLSASLPLGTIRIKMVQPGSSGASGAGTVQRDVDLSSAQTIDDIRSLIEGTGLGLRVRIDPDGRTIEVLNEVAGPSLSIEEVPGAPTPPNGVTASLLGIRTTSWQTPVSVLNDGRGVRIVHGATDPVSGLPDPARDNDFRITLGNGQAFDVDLRPQDMVTIQSVIQRINDEFATALGEPPINGSAPALTAGMFVATLTDGANGIALRQTVGATALSVSKRNNSDAADDLGFTKGAWDSASTTLIAQDRAAVRVDSLFTDLLDLAAALRSNDNAGIAFAGERLTAAADRLSAAQALVGSSAQRVDRAVTRLEEQTIIDESLRSQVQDTDYFEAASRLSLLQTQLNASLQTAGRTFSSRTLLDFLS